MQSRMRLVASSENCAFAAKLKMCVTEATSLKPEDTKEGRTRAEQGDVQNEHAAAAKTKQDQALSEMSEARILSEAEKIRQPDRRPSARPARPRAPRATFARNALPHSLARHPAPLTRHPDHRRRPSPRARECRHATAVTPPADHSNAATAFRSLHAMRKATGDILTILTCTF